MLPRIFSTSCLSPPDVSFGLVAFENAPDPARKARIDLGQPLTDVFVNRALADLEHTGCVPHR